MADLNSEQIYDLTESLKELNRSFRDFSSTGGATDRTGAPTNPTKPATDSFDRGTQKIVNALGLLGAQLTKNAKSESQKNREINAFTKSVEKATAAQDEATLAAKKAAATAQEAVDLEARIQADRARMQRLQDEQVVGSTAALAKLSRTAAQEAKTREEIWSQRSVKEEELHKNIGTYSRKIQRISGEFVGFTRSVANSGDSLSSAVDITSTAISSTASGVSKFASGIATFAAPFGPAGRAVSLFASAIGVAADILGKMTPAVAGAAKLMVEQFEKGLQSFSKLTDVGLVSSFEELRDISATMGMTFQDVAAATSKYSTSLAAAGGSATKGMKIFADVSKQLELDDVRLQFRALGLSAEQTADFQGKYIAQEAKFGMVKNRDAKSLADGTKNYVEQLTLLSKLTGESREGMQAKEDAARGESQYAATLELLKGTKAFDEMKNANMLITSRAGDTIAKGFRASAGGIPMGAEAEALYTQSGGESTRISQRLQAGEITAIQATNLLEAAIKRNMGGKEVKELAKTVGDIGGPFQNMAKIFELNNKEPLTQASADQALKDIDKQKKDAKDPNTYAGAAAKTQDAMYKASVTVQQLSTSQEALTTVLKIAETTVTSFTAALQGATDFFGGKNKTESKPTLKSQLSSGNAKTSNLGAANEVKSGKIGKDEASAILEGGSERDIAAFGGKPYLESVVSGKPIEPKIESIAPAQKPSAAIMDPKLRESLTSSGIKDTRAQANILAQIQAESGGDATKSESLKYTPERLMEVFPKKFKNIQDAQQVAAAGEQAIGDRIYGGRMGNSEQGDGHKYRGRGLVQLTGKDNYKKFSDLVGVDLVKNPDLAADPDIARKIAVAYFKEKQKSGVDLSDSKQVSKAVGHVDINGKESDRRAAMSGKIETALAQKPVDPKSDTALAQKPDTAKSLNDVLTFGSESGSQQAFSNLEESFKSRVVAAAESFNKLTGNKIQINSAHRSDEDQQRLYDAWIKGGQQGMPVAKPGTSLHNRGLAVDIQNYNDPVAVKAFNEQGLSQKVKNDPVHFQARTGGIFKGPSTGYNVELHGEEAVVPMNDGVNKQALNTSVFNQDTQLLDGITAMMAMMTDKYDQLIDLMSRNVDNGEKLVNATV